MTPVGNSRRIIADLALVTILLVAGFYYRDDVRGFYRQQRARFFPCSAPIEYSIRDFSAGFGISRSEFQQSIADAEAIWEKPLGKDLFTYVREDDGDMLEAEATSTSLISRIRRFRHEAVISDTLDINLIYDYRQQATSKLQVLDSSLKVDKDTYAAANATYLSLASAYKAQKAAYESLVAAYKGDKDAYSKKVADANAKGGASPAEYRELKQEETALNQKVAAIRAAESDLNAKVVAVNAAASTVNAMAKQLNIKVATYNTIGASTGREFEEGEYVTDATGQRINIYQFNDRNKLVRVLAHELGHALGLEHIDNPDAIMYRLNEGVNKKLTEDDLNAISKRCDIVR